MRQSSTFVAEQFLRMSSFQYELKLAAEAAGEAAALNTDSLT